MIYLGAIILVLIVIGLSVYGGIQQGKQDIENNRNLRRIAENSGR